MTDAVERALEALVGPPVFSGDLEAVARQALLERFVAAIRSLAADPPAEMVEAARLAVAPILSRPSTERAVSAALTRLAALVETPGHE